MKDEEKQQCIEGAVPSDNLHDVLPSRVKQVRRRDEGAHEEGSANNILVPHYTFQKDVSYKILFRPNSDLILILRGHI